MRGAQPNPANLNENDNTRYHRGVQFDSDFHTLRVSGRAGLLFSSAAVGTGGLAGFGSPDRQHDGSDGLDSFWILPRGGLDER